MFKFFHRKPRITTAPEPELPIFGERISTAPPAAREYARRLLTNLQITEPFTEPDSNEHALWKAGKLVPFYITYLLDAGGHVGPSVDAACLAEEPAVDRWETGVEYPRWDQTVALARFLDVRVRDLTHPDVEPRHHEIRPKMRLPGLAIMSFEPAAVEEATKSSLVEGPALSAPGNEPVR